MTAEKLDRVLTCFETEIVPATVASVACGNKVFGAALLRKDTLETVLVGTNNETENPLWHGEVHTIKLYHEMPAATRPDPRDLIFISSHEPCSMCLSAITWAGFDNFVYLFSYEDSRDAFAIPHDLKILDEVFGLKDGEYQKQNAFWTGTDLRDWIAELPSTERPAQLERLQAIRDSYAAISETYQTSKSTNDIPLS